METKIDENQNNAFIQLGRDVHSVIMSFCTMNDALRLASTCDALWKKSQPALINKLLEKDYSHYAEEGLSFLADVIELCPIFKKYRLNYPHLAIILSRAKSILEPMIKSDPDCAWKIAALCGMEDVVQELLGDKITTIRDQYGRGVMDYYALGGQLGCLQKFLRKHYPPQNQDPNPPAPEAPLNAAQEEAKLTSFCQANNDPTRQLAVMAALGGHEPVLVYCRDNLGYDLKGPFTEKSPEGYEVTLLTYGVTGGHQATIDFLETNGVKEPDRNLAFYAAARGHWLLYDKLAKIKNPIETIEDAIYIAKYAARTGNLLLTLSLIEEYQLDPRQLIRDVVDGGRPEVFWHFVDKGWLSLTDTFGRDETVAHLLAQEGHLSLLREVLQKTTPEQSLYAVDFEGESLLFFAAAGGHFHIYSDVLAKDRKNKLAHFDHNQQTVAHLAAQEGMVWFLLRLHASNPELLELVDINGNTILHSAAKSGDPFFLRLIIDKFGIDLRAVNELGDMLIHNLIQLAPNAPHYWNSVCFILQHYDSDLLDIPNNAGLTVRQAIEDNHAERYFPEEMLNNNTPHNL